MKTERPTSPHRVILFSFETHRSKQGYRTRVTVFSVYILLLLLIFERFYNNFVDYLGVNFCVGVNLFLLAIATWVGFRVLQYSPVVDFLVNIDDESEKVTWPTWPELTRSTLVVLVCMCFFSAYLFLCDFVWQFVLRSLSILNIN